MFRSFIVCLAVVVAAEASPDAFGQGRSSRLLSPLPLARFGLERAWFTHVEVDPLRGGIAHMIQHVSSTEGYTVFEVHYDGGRRVFTERDLDRLGVPLGKEGAQKLAERAMHDLNLLQRNARVTSQVVPEITLYAMTDRAVLHAIDAQTGRTRWSESIGSSRAPSEAPAANDRFVAALNGSDLSLLDKTNGKLIWRRKVRGAVGAGPAITERYVFVPMIGGTIEAYEIDDYRQPPWVFQSHGRAMNQPLYTGALVAWSTDRGHLNVAWGNANSILYRVEINKSIAAEATAMPPDRLLVASVDGYVYCLQAEQGKVVWRFSSGEPILHTPVVLGETVFAITDDGSLYAISGDRGEEVWHTSGVRQFVAASRDRLYCQDERNGLAVIDAANGTLLGTIPADGLDFAFLNKQTDRIIIGTRQGLIQCLHETRQPWPLLHYGGLQEQEPAKPRPKPRPAAAPKKPVPETDTDDPFGIAPAAKPPAARDEGADPFGADPFGAPAPPPAAKDEGTDPFGSDPFGTPSTPPTEPAPAADDPFGSSPF